jgi:hypothetical protein
VVVGIAIAIRAKTGTGKGCGIVMAIAFALQSGLVAIWILITIIAGFESNRAGQTRIVHAIQEKTAKQDKTAKDANHI